MPKKARRLGILTGGRACPGAVDAVEAACATAWTRGWDVLAFDGGFPGLWRARPRRVPPGTADGAIASPEPSRADPFQYPAEKGRLGAHVDRSAEAVRGFKDAGLAGLIVLGGEGTLVLADRFHRRGIPVVGLPKNLDALQPSCWGLGFDSQIAASAAALEALLRSPETDGRVVIAEVGGRETGWNALYCGLTVRANEILIPEVPYRAEKIAERIRAGERSEEGCRLVVAAQGATPADPEAPAAENGRLERLADELRKRLKRAVEVLSLRALQAGAPALPGDRLLARRLGTAAMRLVDEGRFGNLVLSRPNGIEALPLHQLDGRRKVRGVPLDSEWVRTARDLGIGLGD